MSKKERTVLKIREKQNSCAFKFLARQADTDGVLTSILCLVQFHLHMHLDPLRRRIF